MSGVGAVVREDFSERSHRVAAMELRFVVSVKPRLFWAAPTFRCGGLCCVSLVSIWYSAR